MRRPSVYLYMHLVFDLDARICEGNSGKVEIYYYVEAL